MRPKRAKGGVKSAAEAQDNLESIEEHKARQTKAGHPDKISGVEKTKGRFRKWLKSGPYDD